MTAENNTLTLGDIRRNLEADLDRAYAQHRAAIADPAVTNSSWSGLRDAAEAINAATQRLATFNELVRGLTMR